MLFNAENILLIGSVLLFVSIVVSKTGYCKADEGVKLYASAFLHYWCFY